MGANSVCTAIPPCASIILRPSSTQSYCPPWVPRNEMNSVPSFFSIATCSPMALMKMMSLLSDASSRLLCLSVRGYNASFRLAPGRST
ncbi:unnamed protein product [Periconia digitata]|uniref:Uncharacterized protein n=1 Tax=Periconia digitata TaxID=1303443 RepID=A0A9W4XLA5_9PLEO|nr:unnamed protein product [Periconia digitata]